MPPINEFLPRLLVATSIASAVLLVAALVAFPVVLRRLPVDWFEREPAPVTARLRARPWATAGQLAAGTFLAAAGLVMLVLPGQGLLTLAVGLLVVDLPWTARLARRIGRVPRVAAPLQRLRRRSGEAPFVGIPDAGPRRGDGAG